MKSRRVLVRMLATQLRLRFLVALVALVLLCCALTLAFLFEWHRRGDTFALAFGALLSFFASVITAAVTLTYLHVSRRSLAAAEAAIALQREQWDARLMVQPRFWMGIHEEAADRFAHRPLTVTYRRDRADNGQYYYDTVTWPQIMVDVWNDAERARHERHHPAHVIAEMSPERIAEYEEPFGLTPVIEVDTTRPVDTESLAAHIMAAWASVN
jgi:uncharacterized membrane protein